MIKAGYDFLGNVAILKFPEKTKSKEKKEFAKKILKERKNVETVLEKAEKVHGRLRTITTKHLAGKKTKEALYCESGCLFKLNVDSCYFSPRLSNERLEIAGKIKKNDKVLVLFSGVAPFPIVIAKHSQAKKVVAVELGRECFKYALENVKLNKLYNVEIIQGDVKKIDKLIKKEKFDLIVMPRPQLKETFLKYIWKFAKKNSRVYYYDFGKDAEEIIDKVILEAKKSKKKIKIFNFKKAGEIAPYKYRWRVDVRVMN
ncbi:MAG: methyltransferase domain-containing protein [Nanoarchaeota archaeon]